MSKSDEWVKIMVTEANAGLDVPDAVLTHMLELLPGPLLEEKQSKTELAKTAKKLIDLVNPNDQESDS